MPMDESEYSLVVQALSFAAHKHSDQRRKGSDRAPYVNHLIDVLDLLWRVGGVRDGELLAAAVLHDTLEDTATTPQEIEAQFGPRVLGLVLEVTDDKTLAYDVRKQRQIEHAALLSAGARQIKLADKISNVRDLATHPPIFWPQARRRAYRAWAAEVVDRLRGTNPPLEAEFDRIMKSDAEKK